MDTDQDRDIKWSLVDSDRPGVLRVIYLTVAQFYHLINENNNNNVPCRALIKIK